jgi:hypothetical protein
MCQADYLKSFSFVIPGSGAEGVTHVTNGI